MAFQEFKGKLDEPAGTGFVPFTGQLDEPLKKPIQSDPILSPEDVVMSSVGAPSAEPPSRLRKPATEPEFRAYEPSFADQLLNLFPGDRAKAANEANARRIAKEQGISVDEAYRQMKEALGVRGVMGDRPSGQPMLNPEGRAPIQAVVEATPYVVEGIKKMPVGAAEAALRSIRGGAIEDSIDQGFLDQVITNMADDKSNLPQDPNYRGFQGLGKSLGFSLVSVVSAAVAGAAATAATGGNVPLGIATGMTASGSVAYRSSKDDFLNRLRDKLNKDSERLYGTKLSKDQWQTAKDEFEGEAVKYGAWEAVPEALSNAIFLKAFAKPAFAAAGKQLNSLINKAGSLAVENITETATGYGQNASELKAGLTKDEIGIVDAFKQQFTQTAIMMGVMGGGMKGKQLAEKFYNDQVLPRVNPGSALAKAIKADIDAVAYSPEAIRQEAVRRLRPDQAQYELTKMDAPPSTGPVTITPPDEEPFTAPPPPPAPMPPAPGGRIEPNFDEAPPAARPPVDVIPGMMTNEDLAQPENLTVTPVTLTEPEVTPVTLPEPEVTPVTPIQPTLAAELLPETPTVPPAQTPKLFEPSIGEHQAQDMTVVAVPVKELTLSKDVPQFKAGASSKGVVEPLSGKFTQEGVAPIAVWRRLDGAMEVISGRHRLDLAKRSNTDLINAQVYDEAKGFNQSMAATLDAELNIRDEQGKVKDYVNYFKESGTDRETADAKGFLARTKGKRGFTIANQGSDALIAAINSDQIGDEAAYYVAINAPNDERLQSVGIKALMDGKSMNTATNTMQAVKAMAGEQDTTTDMFGFDDSLIKEAQEMAKIAAQMQQAIKNRLSAITGAAKNPAMAKAEGIDVRDPAAIQQRIEELKQRKTALENWSTSPELVAEIRAARGVAPPVLPIFEQPVTPQEVDTQDDFLSMQTPEELRKRAEAQAEAARQQAIAGQEAQRRTQADSEVGDFVLTGSDRDADEAAARGQEDLFGAAPPTTTESETSAEYDAAMEKSNVAIRKFRNIQEAYRNQTIGDEEFLAGRRDYDAAMADYDNAARREQGMVEESGVRGASDEEVADVTPATQAITDSQERIIGMTKKEYRNDEATLGRSTHPSLSIDFDGQDPKSLISQYGEKNVRFLGRLFGITVKDIKSVAKKLIDINDNVNTIAGRTADDFKGMTKAELEPLRKQLGFSAYASKAELIAKIVDYQPELTNKFNTRLQDAKHQAAVTNALRQGVDVKDEVIKDYPDLTAYTRERGSEIYNQAIQKLALKETSNLTGTMYKSRAEGLRELVKKEEDPQSKQVWGDVADKIDQLHRQLFGKKQTEEAPAILEEDLPEAIAEEKEFIEEDTKDKLEAIAQDFMVGDMVRFGSIPGTVVGVEGDYVRMRPDDAKSAKAYQRVPKSSLTFVGRPDTTTMVSYSKEQDNKFGEEAGQLNANMGNLIQLLGANMYSSSLAEVTVKELLQNAFDAVKGAVADTNAKGESIKPLYKTGKIQIAINTNDRTISITDNARGMTPQIVRDAFFTVAGSDKSDLPPGQRSGGLGLAKMGFMLGAKNLKLDTVRDGVRVTVDTSSTDIANNNFTIQKSPAPKGEHGTTVTVKIPQYYIDPKNGDENPIYFPYSLRSIGALNKPLIGPVEVSFKRDTDESAILPIGVNFEKKNYTQFKANFDWGSADIFFGIERKPDQYSINHQVLSAGVYQFNPSFKLDDELIPYDIIVNIAPNVDARHPDYPFVNSRESFKDRIKKDVEALQQYLGQISRGLEAKDLQESFKGVVSMPRMEAGQDIANIAEKLKKTFGSQKPTVPTKIKALPKEVTVTADAVTDTTTRQILVDVKSKDAEKQKDASFKGSEAPKAVDFMLDLKQDPKLPAYHNNTNVDYLAIGRPYGEPEQFFAELGTLVVEMKEELAKSGFYGYEKLSPESLFFAGVSIDKKYGGVHIRVPYKAIFVNPFYSFGGRTIFGIRQQLLNTMMHEIAHTGSMDHGVAHNTQMIKVEQYLADEGLLDYYRDAILDILRRHESTFTAMKEAYDKSSTQNTAKSLEDYAQDSSAASARGDEGGARNAPSAIPSRERQGRGEGISRAQADDEKRQDRKGAREDGKDGKPSDFLMNVEKPEDITEEPSLAEQGEDLIVGSKAIREWQIGEYARLRAQLARVPKQVAEGKVDLRMQAAVTRLMQQARDLNSEIKSTKPRRDSAEQFLAKAALEFDKGNISEDVFNVIKMAYDKMPDVLEGLLLSVKSQGEKKAAAGQFLAFERIVRLYKGTSGIDDPATIRHELAHSLEQMMNPEQRLAVAQAWVKGLLAAVKKHPDETHQKYFNAVMDFIDSPSETNFRKAVKLLPSYEMYQFINPSEFWAVNAEKLMAAELGTAWEKFKRAIARLWEGIKNVVGFDNRYVVQKMFKDIMNGSRNRITTDMLVDLVGGTGVKFNVLENIEDDKKLLEKHSRPNTPQLDSSPLRTQIINSSKLGKEFLKLAVTDPLGALGTAANSVDRAVVYARNKNVWFGSGLNSADFSKYNGELLNSQGLATASVALDNAIRGGQIATEVIFQGGIKFDPKSRNFVAVQRDKGMRGVYEAEAALKKRLGNQLGTDIIQGYLEAKRSRSIQNEYFQREAEYEFAKNEYEDLQATGASEKDIMVARNAMVDAREDLKAIEVVYKKISMSEEEIDDFIERDTVHPELRKIMQNWSAINQNMLAFWRQVGLLSESRYDNLSNIKDYVPWQRIMNDETDIHSPVQTTNRKMTNIGLEKLFKKGKPTVITDVVAKDGQQDFKIQPATEVDVEINGNPVAPDKVTMTADGKVKVDMPITKGDLVVFKASREIENIIDNMTRNVMRMTMNGLRQAAAQRIVMEYATRDKNQKIMVFPKADKERGRFDFIVSGQRIVVEIQDPLIAESIFGMESLNLVMLKPLAAVANFTRRTITLSGAFQIKQVFKDAPTAALVTGVKHPLLLIGGVYKGFVTSLTNTDPTIKILKAAGIGGFQSAARTPEAEIKRRLGIMKRNVFDFMIKGLDHIGDASDMAQRVAVYKRVLAETGDETQALYQAANVINFLHHGSGQVSQMVVKTVPFAGAYANSMDVLIQALAGGGLKGRSRSSALARLAMTGTLLTGITLLYCMMVGDDDEYNQMDDQTKLRNFMIPGTKIILPMNTSAAYFYKAVPEMIYNKIMKEGTKDAVDERRLRTALKEAAIDMLLGPTPVPSGIKPFIEIGLNKNFFTGRPVVPESLVKLDAAERYTADTSEAGKFLSSLTGTKETRALDPIEADHLIKGIFGTAGAMAQWFTNSIAVSTGERVAMTDKQTPLTGSFLRADVGRRNEDLFYDFKSLVDNKYGTYSKMLEREDEKQADAYEKKHGNILDFYKEVNKIDSELKEINSEIRYYGESKDTRLTPDKRRQEIKLLQLEKQELLEETIEMRKEAGL